MAVRLLLILLQGVWVGLGGLFGWFFGRWDGLFYALFAFMIIDYISGVLCAALEKELCSKVGMYGIARKVMMLLIIGLANVVDVYIIGEGSAAKKATIFFFISNEGISLLENAARMGIPIPPKLRELLAINLKQDGGNK